MEAFLLLATRHEGGLNRVFFEGGSNSRVTKAIVKSPEYEQSCHKRNCKHDTDSSRRKFVNSQLCL